MSRIHAVAFAALALTACDTNFEVPAAATVCTQSGVQCQMPEGPLGVCERTHCSDGTQMPCFQCTPQH